MDLQSELRLQSFWKIGNLVELLPRYWHSHQPLVAMRTGFLCEAHMLFVEEPHTTLFAEWSSSRTKVPTHTFKRKRRRTTVQFWMLTSAIHRLEDRYWLPTTGLYCVSCSLSRSVSRSLRVSSTVQIMFCLFSSASPTSRRLHTLPCVVLVQFLVHAESS
jgi:hypothetical protein